MNLLELFIAYHKYLKLGRIGEGTGRGGEGRIRV